MRESMRRGYFKNVGPGGIACPCCNPYGCHPRKMKKKVKRVNRRKAKQKFNKEMSE